VCVSRLRLRAADFTRPLSEPLALSASEDNDLRTCVTLAGKLGDFPDVKTARFMDGLGTPLVEAAMLRMYGSHRGEPCSSCFWNN
jgi:hypothetical protein